MLKFIIIMKKKIDSSERFLKSCIKVIKIEIFLVLVYFRTTSQISIIKYLKASNGKFMTFKLFDHFSVMRVPNFDGVISTKIGKK